MRAWREPRSHAFFFAADMASCMGCSDVDMQKRREASRLYSSTFFRVKTKDLHGATRWIIFFE